MFPWTSLACSLISSCLLLFFVFINSHHHHFTIFLHRFFRSQSQFTAVVDMNGSMCSWGKKSERERNLWGSWAWNQVEKLQRNMKLLLLCSSILIIIISSHTFNIYLLLFLIEIMGFLLGSYLLCVYIRTFRISFFPSDAVRHIIFNE